jgi:hypothetical protein
MKQLCHEANQLFIRLCELRLQAHHAGNMSSEQCLIRLRTKAFNRLKRRLNQVSAIALEKRLSTLHRYL